MVDHQKSQENSNTDQTGSEHEKKHVTIDERSFSSPYKNNSNPFDMASAEDQEGNKFLSIGKL